MSLTEDDKHWITTLLETKLDAVEMKFEAKLDAVESKFEAKLDAIEIKFDAKLEAVETRLLRAFHDWASPVDMRARSHAAAIRALDIEVESLGNRVSRIEPPQ